MRIQLMDRPGFLLGAGLPFRFDGFEPDGEVRDGVPTNRQAFTVPPAGAQPPGAVPPGPRAARATIGRFND